MKKILEFRFIALLISVTVSNVYALSGSTWKIMNINNDLGHDVRLSDFNTVRGDFILANLPGGLPVNNNRNFIELNGSTQIVIPAGKSIDSKESTVNFTVLQSGSDITNKAKDKGYSALVYVAQTDENTRYATMILDPTGSQIPDISTSVYYGYSGRMVKLEVPDYTYFISALYNSEGVKWGRENAAISGIGTKGGMYRVDEILYDPSATHIYGPAYNEISVAADICANQSTIDKYLNCFKD